MRHIWPVIGMICAPFGAAAQSQDHDLFIEANILAVFYHELGHAVIDVEDLPIFGQEEDAADGFSIYMIDALYVEDVARDLAYASAKSFLAEAEFEDHTGEAENWSSTHGATEQRFFNSICLFYGANPDARADLAQSLGLPERRADSCEEEFEQADHSWGGVLDDLIARGGGDSLRFDGRGIGSRAAELLANEAAYFNDVLQLSSPVRIVVESCGEANAYYDPAEREVQFCSEFETYFEDMARWLF